MPSASERPDTLDEARQRGDRRLSQSPSFPAPEAPSTALRAVPLPRAKRGGGWGSLALTTAANPAVK